MTELESLLEKAVPPGDLRADGNYTLPRRWGVYRVVSGNRGHRREDFRMGNHSIREIELRRELGAATLVALYTSRENALALKALLKAQAT